MKTVDEIFQEYTDSVNESIERFKQQREKDLRIVLRVQLIAAIVLIAVALISSIIAAILYAY